MKQSLKSRVHPALLLASAVGAVLNLTIIPAGPAAAGAWTQPPGGAYVKLEAAWLSTDRVFDSGGDRIDYISALSPGTYRERQVRAYAEYGLHPRLTLLAATAFQWLTVREEGVIWKTWGVSDLRVGGRYGLPTRGTAAALAAEIKLPTGYDRNEFPSLGSGDPDLTFGVEIGRSFGPFYLAGSAGYTFRVGPLADEFPWSAELGWRPAPRFGLRGTLRGRTAMTNDLAGGGIDLTRVDSESLKLGGAVTVGATRRFDLEVAFAHALSGRQTLTGTEAALALVWHR